MKKDFEEKTVVSTPDEILNSKNGTRYTHFIKRGKNSAADLTVIFSAGCLYFSDATTEKEAVKYSKLFYAFATAKWLNGKAQDKRYAAITERYGDQGSETALDMFKYYRSLYK